MKEIILSFPEDSPDNSAIEGQVNMFTAMIEIRLEQFGVEVGGNYVSLLGLKGQRFHMYNDMAIPFALGTIAKGRSLMSHESQMAIMEYSQEAKDIAKRRIRRGGAISGGVSSKSSGGKKKGKKKGEKNRK